MVGEVGNKDKGQEENSVEKDKQFYNSTKILCEVFKEKGEPIDHCTFLAEEKLKKEAAKEKRKLEREKSKKTASAKKTKKRKPAAKKTKKSKK